jgi:hypothetical protein
MIGNSSVGIAFNERSIIKSFTINPAQATGTYDICTASGGDIWIKSSKIYTGSAVIGLVSLSVQTNMGSPVSVMTAGEGAVAALLADTLIATAFTGPIVLPSGKKLQYTIVGTGSAGTMKLFVEFMRSAATGDLV